MCSCDLEQQKSSFALFILPGVVLGHAFNHCLDTGTHMPLLIILMTGVPSSLTPGYSYYVVMDDSQIYKVVLLN